MRRNLMICLMVLNASVARAKEISIACEAKDGSYLPFTNPQSNPSPWSPVRELIRASLVRTPEGNYEGTAVTDFWPGLAERQLPATWTPSMGHLAIYEPNWGGGKRPFKLIGIDVSKSARELRSAAEVSTSRETADGVLITRYVCTVKCGRQAPHIGVPTCD